MDDISDIRTIAQVLPHHTARTPHRTAVQYLDGEDTLRSLTYAGLEEAVTRFAAVLNDRGARPGRTVAILMPNSVRWLVAYFAVFRAGAIAVPLEDGMLETDPDRLRYAIRHSEAHLVICAPDDLEAVRSMTDAPVVSACERTDAAPPDRPDFAPSDLAQILYTSGTTGPKKGVELTHHNLIFDIEGSCRRFGVRPDDCLPALLPYHHAYPLTTTVILPLYAGATMAAGDIRDRRSRELMRRVRPTVFVGVPRVFEAILDSVRSSAERGGRLEQFERARRLAAAIKDWTALNVGKLLFRQLHTRLFGGLQLRFAVSGGARISPRIIRELFVLGIPLLQGWGMSELSPVGTVQRFSRWRFYFTRYYERKAGSIGTPLVGTQIEFTQSSVEELSFDLEHWGEMLVRGPHVMRGYHKDPHRTAQQMSGDALRTGDIARRDADGDLYIVGRVKHVIVLPSGKKVFPEDELEEPLADCATIREFAVRPISGPEDEEKIGVIVRPEMEQLSELRNVGELYAAIKRDIDAALAGRATYLKQYDFCLTAWDEERGEYEELLKTAMGDPSPLRNPFSPERAYSRLKTSREPVPWRR
ncbi:MAG: long-chain fatty acid--CoA ligase [Candidatus Brocadiaceae bacterium]|jgi:long-chain acyl-CoA synthetase